MLISEALKPDLATADTSMMEVGGPVLPARFFWRKAPLDIAKVRRSWRETGPCTHGSGERYVRKHWYEVETADERVAQIYFERKLRGSRSKRWWLYTIDEATHPHPIVADV